MRADPPWGLSGPAFVVLYGFALVLVCCAVAVARAAARRPDFRDDTPVELGRYERAFLNGGAHRVADTAVAGLLAAGKLRISRQRRIAFVGPGEPEDEFQRLVRHHLDSHHLDGYHPDSSATVRDVRRAVRQSGACEPLVRSLRERQLLVPARVRRRVLGVTALFPLLMLVGVVRAVNGEVLGRPIGNLLVELLITGTAWWIAATACQQPLVTRFGAAVQPGDPVPEQSWTDQPRRFRPFRHHGQASLEAQPLEAASAVAVGGLAAYPDSTIAKLVDPGGSGGGGGVAGGGGGGCGG